MAAQTADQRENCRQVIERMVAHTVIQAAQFEGDANAITGILIDLNRLSAAVVLTDHSPDAGVIVESLLHRLGTVIARHSNAGEFATEMINAINELAAFGVTCGGPTAESTTIRRRGQANV